MLARHRHISRKISAGHELAGKKVYIPAMAQGSVEAFASVFRWLGIDASPTPPSNQRTQELGARFTAGDECYPAKVTSFALSNSPALIPTRPYSSWPPPMALAASGSTHPFLRKLLDDAGYADVQVFSPHSKNG